MTNKSNFNVRFNDFGESSLNILVYFHIERQTTLLSLRAVKRFYCESWTSQKDGASICLPPAPLGDRDPFGDGRRRASSPSRRNSRPTLTGIGAEVSANEAGEVINMRGALDLGLRDFASIFCTATRTPNPFASSRRNREPTLVHFLGCRSWPLLQRSSLHPYNRCV